MRTRPAAGRALGRRGTGPHLRASPGTGVEGEERWRPATHAHHRTQAAAQAGRRRPQPHLHLHRTPRRLPDAEGPDGGNRGVVGDATSPTPPTAPSLWRPRQPAHRTQPAARRWGAPGPPGMALPRPYRVNDKPSPYLPCWCRAQAGYRPRSREWPNTPGWAPLSLRRAMLFSTRAWARMSASDWAGSALL